MVVDEQYLDEQYIKNLGILGSRIEKQTEVMEDLSDDFDQFFLDNRRDRGNGIVSRDGLADADPDDFISDLVGAMGANTYTVKVSNFVSGLLQPLSDQMELFNMESSENLLSVRNGLIIHLERIHEAVESLKSSNLSFLERTVNHLRFIREHPGLAAMSALSASIKFTVGSVWKLVTGFSKRKSDTDRIVESNDKISEILLTGQVDQTKSMWETFKEGGLLKLTARGVAGVLGGEERAQERKDAREMGIDVDKSITGRLVDNFYKGSLVDKTREKLQEETNRKIDEMVDGFNNPSKTQQSCINCDLLNTMISGVNTILLPKMNQSALGMDERPFFSTMNDIMTGSFIKSSVAVENQKANKVSEQEQAETLFREKQEDLLSSLERNSSQTYKTTKEMNSRQEDIQDQNKRIVKWSKDGVKEQVKTRRMMQLKAILGFLGGIVSAALTIGSNIVGSVVSGVTTIVAALAALGGIKAILKGGFAKPTGLLGGVLKKIPVVGKFFDKASKAAPAASVASKAAPAASKAAPKLGKGMGVATAAFAGYSAWNEKSAELEGRDDLTDTQKNIQKTGNAAGAGLGAVGGATLGLKAGAATGAAIGSIIPGLGTAVGGVVGGAVGSVIGGVAGSELGQFIGDKMSGLVSGFFGKEEKTIGDQLQEKTDDLSGSMDEFKEKSEGFFSSAFGTVSKWYKDAKGYFFDDGGIVDEMKDGTDSLRHSIDKNTNTAKDLALSTLDMSKRVVDASLGIDGKKESESTTVTGDKFKGSLKKQEEFINESAIKRHESLVKLMGDFYSEKDEENAAKLKTIEAEYNANIAKYQQMPTETQEATKGFFSRLWDGIKSALKKAASWIGGVAKSAWGKVKGWFGSDEEEKIVDAVKKETKPEENKEGFLGGNSSKSWFSSDKEEPVVDAVKKETKPEENKEGFFGGMWNSAKSWFGSDEEEPVVDAVKSQETPWKTERSEDGSVVTRTFTGQGSMREQLVKEQQEALEQYKATGNIEQRPDEDLGDFYRRRETIKQLASSHGIKAASSPTVKGISEPMGASPEQRQNQMESVKEMTQTTEQKANSDAIAASINDMKTAIMQFVRSAAATGQQAVAKFENVIEENDFMNVTGR